MQQCIDFHELIAAKSPAESKLWLKQKITSCTLGEGTQKVTHMVVNNKHVCSTGFKLLYGISNNKYYGACKKSEQPEVIPLHSNKMMMMMMTPSIVIAL